MRAAAHEKQVGGSYDEEYRVVRPDGAIRWIRDRGVPIRDHAGQVYRIAGIADAVLATIAAGADGYLLKEIDGEGLLHAIRTVMGGQSILDPAVTQPVLRKMQSLSRVEKDESPELSAQEQRVLAFVAEGKTNKEIAAALGLSDKTVRHVTRRSQAAAYFVRRTAN